MLVAKLYLLRHAKAGWALPGTRDFDRALDPSGIADAEAIGTAMRANGYVPDLTLCSGALRARETLGGIASHTDTGRVLYFDKLYSEDAAGAAATTLLFEPGEAWTRPPCPESASTVGQARKKQTAEIFLTRSDSPRGHCCACHSSSWWRVASVSGSAVFQALIGITD